MLRDSTAVVVVVHTRPRAIPLAMVHMRKSIHGFPSVHFPNMGMGLRLATFGCRSSAINRFYREECPHCIGKSEKFVIDHYSLQI